MTNAPYRRTVNYTVNEVAAVEGNYGPQWQLSGDVSAMPNDPGGGNWGKYPQRFWISQDNTPQPTAGTFQCVIERGDKTKPDNSGDIEWHFRWKMIEFNTNGSPPSSQVADTDSSPVTPFESDADRRERLTRRSIERQTALNAAVQSAVTLAADTPILQIAQSYYDWITQPVAGPTGQGSEEEPDTQADADDAEPDAEELAKITHLRDNAPAQIKVADFTAATTALNLSGDQIVAYLGGMSRRGWIEDDEENRTNRDALLLVLNLREAELRQSDMDFEEI